MLSRLNKVLIKWFTPGHLPKSEWDIYQERLEAIQASKERFISNYIYNLDHPNRRRVWTQEISR